MIQGIYITTAELDLLAGLPHLVRSLYVELRRLMDFGTGLVGARYPHTSWRALSERCYVEPHPGVKSGRPSEQQMRRAGGWLVRCGLVQMRSNPRQWHLIFFLPVAKRGFFVSDKADNNPTTKADRALHRGKARQPDSGGMVEADTHQGSEYQYHHTESLNLSPYGEPVDNLIHPAALRPAEKAQIGQLLVHANGHAQAILDELAGAIEKGAIQKGAVPFVKGCIAKAKAGSFVPDKGKAVAARRARSTQEPRTGEGQGVGTPPASRASARAAIAESRAILKGSRA